VVTSLDGYSRRRRESVWKGRRQIARRIALPYPKGSWVAEEVEVFDWWSAKWFEAREARA